MSVQYNFGITKRDGEECRFLRVKSDVKDSVKYSEGTYQSFKQEYEDCIISYNFKVLTKFKEDSESENYYAWYYITDLYQIIDNTKKIEQALKQSVADIDYLTMLVESSTNEEEM